MLIPFYLSAACLGFGCSAALVFVCDRYGWYSTIKNAKHWGIYTSVVLALLYLSFTPNMLNTPQKASDVLGILEGVYHVIYSMGFFGVMASAYELGLLWLGKKYRYW